MNSAILITYDKEDAINEAKDRIESIRTSIVNDSISFSRAARLYSDDSSTSNNVHFKHYSSL